MSWLAWRQFRTQALVAAAARITVLVILAATRATIADAPDDLSTPYQTLRLLGTALIGLPAAIGAFWGAPLVARELEAGTHRLAWTQSISRRRWLAVKVAVIAATTVLVTAAFSLTFTWWSLPFDQLGNRIGTANFGQRGVAPIAYALFALALGTFLGLVMRRTLPAMATTLVGFFVVRFMFQVLVRPHLGSPVSLYRPTSLYGSVAGTSATDGGWVLSTRSADAAGHLMTPAAIDKAVADACGASRSTAVEELAQCAHQRGFQDLVRVHPASDFWQLQTLEAAAFVVLTGAVVAMCFWWIQHRAT